jgi:eukaryotic-like serine/threonine-protein kinase
VSATPYEARPFSPLSLRPPKEDPGSVALVDVLHGEEVARARVFFRVVVVIALVTGGFIPALSGERWLRITSALLCLAGAAIAMVGLVILRKPERYTHAVVSALGAGCGAIAVAVIYYIGPFSAGAMVLTLGVYFFGTSHSRVGARVTYGTIALAYLASSGGVAAGVLADRALFSTSGAESFTRWFQVLMSQVILALTFYLARSSRRATEGAIDRVNRATVQIQQRDAMLDEARGELARAMRPGEGRYTGQLLDEYKVGELIGRGAMGEVYKGIDRMRTPVAIKLLHPEMLEDPARVQRFIREAEAASAVNSPHVPRIFGSGSVGENPYLVMELLDGHDLGWHLRRTGKLELELVVDMCEQVARALADVRTAGVVHRDLKPANLFLTDSLPRTWKVLDFGLSKILWESGSLTRDSAVGTPAYMAPEQVRGPKVDHKTDLYALAAIAYRSITGIPPFAGDQVAHVLYRVVYQQPPCPGQLVRVPVDVELVLAIGMAKKSEDRFEKVEDFAAAMRAAAQGALDDDLRARGWSVVKAAPWGATLKPSAAA